jgi:hypothetical protein
MITADALWLAAIGAIAWGIICTYAAIHYARKARRLEERVSSKLWRELGWAHAVASDCEITTEEMERALSTIIGDWSPLPGEIAEEVVGRRFPYPPAPGTVFPIGATAQEIASSLEKQIGGGAQVDPDGIMVNGECIGETLVGRREPYPPIPSITEYRGVVAGDIASEVKVGDEVWIGEDACKITWMGLPDEEGNVGMHATRVSMVARRPVTWEECATCHYNVGGECSNPNAIIGPSSGRDRCTGYWYSEASP